MASLSHADLPLGATGRGSGSYRSVKSSTTGNLSSSVRQSAGEIDGIDPEKADILASPDLQVDDVDLDPDHGGIEPGDSWDSDGLGGPEKSQASVWRTFVCRYRYVLAGVAVLVLASMFAGIAIGSSSKKNRGPQPSTDASAANEQAEGDKGLDVPEVTPPDEPKGNHEPEHEPHGKPKADEAEEEDEGKDKGDKANVVDNARPEEEEDDKGRDKGAKTGGTSSSTATKTGTGGGGTGTGAGAGAGGPNSLSYEQRRRRILGSLRKIKPAKLNRHSAKAEARADKKFEKKGAKGKDKMRTPQKKWRGGTLGGGP